MTLSDYHKQRLKLRHEQALIHARKEAVKWHNARKAERLAYAISEGKQTLKKIEFDKREILELALAILYLGEGSKKNSQTAMGNSDPLILNFFVQAIQKLYGISPADFTCHLHLRADQDSRKMERYWSRALGIPLKNFRKALIDKRTLGSKTYPYYKGVCAVNCSGVAIQRKLMYIATAFCSKVAGNAGG